MSLSLVQDYSSEEDRDTAVEESDDGSEDDRREASPPEKIPINTIPLQIPENGKASLLPSAEDLFSEVTGPPEFLKGNASEPVFAQDKWGPSSGMRFTSTDRTRPPAEGDQMPPTDSKDDTKDRKEAARPDVIAGAVLYNGSTAVPRPAPVVEKSSVTETDKRKGSKIKDKEKNKRMKGQSSHATWKSETEMHLRQQFD